MRKFKVRACFLLVLTVVSILIFSVTVHWNPRFRPNISAMQFNRKQQNDPTNKQTVIFQGFDPGSEFSQSFHAFVKSQDSNFSSVAEYLTYVGNYLRGFRSPWIREDPKFYSWPEPEDKKENGSTRTRTLVWYTPSADSHKRPFEDCPVKDCVLSTNINKDFAKADAVIFEGFPETVMPTRAYANQLYVFFTMESPILTNSRNGKNTPWNKAFNWTWNYRTDSDIFSPVRYLKRSTSLPSHTSLLKLKHQKVKYVAWFTSKCDVQSKRDAYVKKLQKFIPVDVYGRCGPLKCSKGNPNCSTMVNDYLFYLSFENAMCVDYFTEKVSNLFHAGIHVVPVVRGGANYSRFFPSRTVIDAESFAGPEQLAHHLLDLAKDDARYVDMLWRKAHFLYHQFGTVDGFCQLCYKLHHADRFNKTYPDLYEWYHSHDCRPPRPF